MSLRRYLVLILSAILILVTFTAAIQGYKNSMLQASSMADNNLKLLAETLEQLDTSALQMVANKQQSQGIVIQLWQHKKLVLTSNSNITSPLSFFEKGFSNQNVAAKRWRVYSYKQAYTQGKDNWIIVAQPIAEQFTMAEQLILSAMTPLIFSIPLLALLIWFIVWRALTPLTQLISLLQQKRANDLSPVSLPNLSTELIAVQSTLNQLFSRLEHSFTQEKQFASDAAHELRTPLTALTITSNNLLKEEPENNTVQQLASSVERMAHVIDQILVLNRTTPEQFSHQLQQTNIRLIAQQVIVQLYPEINKKQQNIELDADDIVFPSSEFALATLLQNLISNASKYSPTKSSIIVTIKKVDNIIQLTVEDSGEGIAVSERDRVFNRFYRIGGDQHHSQVIGCGLGLAIVKHVVILHQGKISLCTSPKLGGLLVLIELPLTYIDDDVGELVL